MKNTAKAFPGAKEAKIHNPSGRGVVLDLQPPKKGNAMAKTKKANAKKRKGGSKKKKRNNSGSASGSSKKANPKKANSKKRGNAKKAARKWTNPLPSIGDVTLTEWGAFALAAIGCNTLAGLIATPGGWPNIGIQLGLTALSAKFAPRSVRTAVTFGAGGSAVVSVVNKLTNNAIPTTIQRYIGPLVPQNLIGNGSNAGAQQAAGQGLAGPRREGYGGLVAVPPGFAAYAG